jgi:tetratricopeptide (TPR) repeat protein
MSSCSLSSRGGTSRGSVFPLVRALAAAGEARARIYRGEALRSLGSAYSGLADPVRAIDCYEQAIVIYRELGDLPFLVVTLTELGDAQVAAGDLAAARGSRTLAARALDRLPLASAQQVRAWISRESEAVARAAEASA